ncbi:MAG: electron transport complex subunit E [Clostridia bacterium]|nr:electron transport complex subunit E [Clostridia bacterium]
MSCSKISKVLATNPVLILFLGACPAMGATATFMGALGMGVAATIVMVLSGAVIASLKKLIPAGAFIPVSVIITAGFVTLVQMLMQAFLPDTYSMMGIYLTVAAVDLLVFANGEAAYEGSTAKAVLGALKIGVFFIVALGFMGAVREVFGAGSIAGFEIKFFADYSIPLLQKAPGGFIVFSFVAAVISKCFATPDSCTCSYTTAAVGMGCSDKEGM